MDLELLAQIVFVSYVLMQFVNTLIKPIVDIINAALNGEPVKAMIIALWPMYLTVVIAGTIGWFANFNLLPMFEPEVIGRVLTAIGIGLGPSFLYDLQDKPPPEVTIHFNEE